MKVRKKNKKHLIRWIKLGVPQLEVVQLLCTMSKVNPHKEAYLQKLGARIRSLRIAAGYPNHETFAFEHGFGRSQINRYETGKTEPGTYTLKRICDALEITETAFFEEGFGK